MFAYKHAEVAGKYLQHHPAPPLDLCSSPAKIDGIQGKALKSILSYLKQLCRQKGKESEEDVLNAFKFIFANWSRLDEFLQKQIKLSQINSNLPNIIQNLKKTNNQKNIADDILAKYK